MFKVNTARKRFDDFNNSIELIRKSSEMKLEEGKKPQNIFKSNLNEISKGRYKLKEQTMTLQYIKFLDESREAVIKLFNDFSIVLSANISTSDLERILLKSLKHSRNNTGPRIDPWGTPQLLNSDLVFWITSCCLRLNK